MRKGPGMIVEKPFSLDLSAEHLGELARHGVARSYAKNTVIVNEGDATDSLYIVLVGRVKVYVADENGKEATLNIEGPGSYFGEMILDGGPRSASVMTLEPSKFAVVSKLELERYLIENPEVALHIIKRLISRARALTENVKSLALLDVYGRVARLLLDLSGGPDGKGVIAEKLTQQDIANRVGASREMVSRILGDLSKGGYIQIADKKIIIKKKPPARW
ncbi:MAG: Crp/Fnr family transcriptional regulator [Burkholderiales bacterium]